MCRLQRFVLEIIQPLVSSRFLPINNRRPADTHSAPTATALWLFGHIQHQSKRKAWRTYTAWRVPYKRNAKAFQDLGGTERDLFIQLLIHLQRLWTGGSTRVQGLVHFEKKANRREAGCYFHLIFSPKGIQYSTLLRVCSHFTREVMGTGLNEECGECVAVKRHSSTQAVA